MFGSLLGGAYEMTRHEIGRLNDSLTGCVPMSKALEVVRVPPPFPLSAYLVMKRAG